MRRLDRTTRLPLVVTLPAVWVALEFLRSHLATGFSWYCWATRSTISCRSSRWLTWAAVYAVSVLVAAVNALLFEVLYARPWFRPLFALPEPARADGRRALLGQGVAVALLLAGQPRLRRVAPGAERLRPRAEGGAWCRATSPLS